MRNIVILGSTGSIGRSTLDVAAKFPDRFRIVGLTAGKNLPLLLEQIRRFHPEVVAVPGKDTCTALQEALGRRNSPEILCGSEGISTAAGMPAADIVVSAIVGAAGLLPTLAAIRAGKIVALANKETLVMAGPLAMTEAKRCGATLLPVDSEHSAIFQCIQGRETSSVEKIILTASGGPFIGKTLGELVGASPEDALRHPNWSMGKKISIDSATLMNKGLEVIEAHYLFDFPPERIDVLIHPQSIVHSLVEFVDGSYMAQLSVPDMKGPIAYALSFPERLTRILEPLAWERLSPAKGGLTFQRPDTETFPCLTFAYSAIKAGGTMPAVLNASNEVAVKAFLDAVIGFNDIPAIIKKVMEAHRAQSAEGIESIVNADRWAREEAKKLLAHS